MTATRIAAAGGGGGGGTLAGVYDITAYGASTGSADNTTAINNAVAAWKAGGGGGVYVPPGVYKYSGQINLDQTFGLRLYGAGGTGEISTSPSELRYTGSGSTPPVSCHSIFGAEFDHLRFTYDNSAGSFTGDLFDVDGGPHAADCTNWSIHDCAFKHLATITARSMIRLNKAINGTIRDCGMAGGTNTIRMGDPGGSYVVGVRVTGCTFNFAGDTHILIGSADAENLSIDNNRFEASINTTGIKGATTAVDGGNCLCYALEISNNWFGDAGGSVDWVKGLRALGNGPVTVRANYFADCGVSGTHVNTDTSAGINLLLLGNAFTSGLNIFNVSSTSTVTMLDNHVNDPTNLCNGGGDRPLNLVVLNNRTSGSTLANNAYDTLPARMALGIGKASGAFAGLTLDPGPTGAQEQLVLGASSSATRVALGKKGGIYTSVGGADSGTHCLNIQAPTDDTTRQVAIVAGTTPTVRLSANGTGLGFYTAAPVAQPSRVGQLTDSTGGTVSTTLAAGITDSVAKNAIASLAAKVNALETVLHNNGLTA